MFSTQWKPGGRRVYFILINETFNSYQNFSGTPENFNTLLPSTNPIRVIINGHHPNENPTGNKMGKLIHLPDSIEDLFIVAGNVML